MLIDNMDGSEDKNFYIPKNAEIDRIIYNPLGFVDLQYEKHYIPGIGEISRLCVPQEIIHIPFEPNAEGNLIDYYRDLRITWYGLPNALYYIEHRNRFTREIQSITVVGIVEYPTKDKYRDLPNEWRVMISTIPKRLQEDVRDILKSVRIGELDDDIPISFW